MAKYEYHHIQQKVGLTSVLDKTTLVKLNKLGKQGWELANVFNLMGLDGQHHIFYVLKREIE
ncbi:DUF4177 domain-containing protein [Chloroflexota bacterium]